MPKKQKKILTRKVKQKIKILLMYKLILIIVEKQPQEELL